MIKPPADGKDEEKMIVDEEEERKMIVEEVERKEEKEVGGNGKDNLKMFLPSSCPLELKGRSESKKALLQCTQCNLKFTTETDLKQHKQLHSDAVQEKQKSYKCQNCDEVFRWRSEYKKHSEIGKS